MITDTQHFKTLLENEKNTLESGLGNVAEKTTTSGDWSPRQTEVGEDTADREDVAEALTNFDENTVTSNTLETQLSEVNHALEKIAAGNYGTCEECGNDIEEDRLEANPSARTCKAHLG